MSNKKLTKVSTKELIKKLDEYSNEELDELLKNSSIEKLEKIVKKREEESIKDLKERLDPNNKSTTNWYDKNKFNKILTTIDSNNFNHKYKICQLKCDDINHLINYIKNNTISEANAKKKKNKRIK